MAIRRSRLGGMIGDVVIVRRNNRSGSPGEVWNDPRDGDPDSGNASAFTLRDLYSYWNAAYRGLSPHGVLTQAPNSPDMVDNPATFDETDADFDTVNTQPLVPEDGPPYDLADIHAVPIVVMDDLSALGGRAKSYFTAWTMGVTATIDTLVADDPSRTSIRIYNAGPGTVYIAETESKGYTGFPLAAASSSITINSTRGVYAIQQSGQASPAQVSLLAINERREIP